MRTQQQAEREEQQRIKNLVLNYDLTDDQQDGEQPSFHYVHNPNSNRVRLVGKGKLNQSLPTRTIRGGQPQHTAASPAANNAPQLQHSSTGGDKRRTSLDSGYSSPPPLLPALALLPVASICALPTVRLQSTAGTVAAAFVHDIAVQRDLRSGLASGDESRRGMAGIPVDVTELQFPRALLAARVA